MEQIKKIIHTSRNIILNPAKEWITIKNSKEDYSTTFSHFALPYILFVSISSFILFLKYTNATGAIIGAVMYGVVFLISIYLNAIIMNELLPFFNSDKNKDFCFKLLIYSSVPEWIAFILIALVPFLGIVHIVASVYSLYLLWKGIELFNLVSAEKRIQYTVTVILTWFIINFFVSYFSKSIVMYLVEKFQF